MLKQIILTAAFLIILSCVISCFVCMQRLSVKQLSKLEQTIELANETDRNNY